jgi:hypothetical protein
VLAACGGTDAPPPQPQPQHDTSVAIAPPPTPSAPTPDAAPPPPPAPPEVWLKGTTHVHARPSGDSSTPIPEVIEWYEKRGYDFIVLTDHNQVSELDKTSSDTTGQIAIRAPEQGLIVFAGTELTSNPTGCTPPRHPSGNCRIHANLLGVTARPKGKFTWANTRTKVRVELFAAAIEKQKQLGGILQLNHPNWFWSMSSEELIELVKRGYTHFEVWNSQQKSWNVGSGRNPSLEKQWDAVLAAGLTLWGIASDDAHHYNDKGLYPAGGGWIVVRARRDPAAILDAIAKGRFYSSTGVVLERAEVTGGELVIEVAPSDRTHTIDLIENGSVVASVKSASTRRALPASGYVRAVVTRSDGAKAWIQPARRQD